MATTVIRINPFKAQNARTARRLFRQFNHILQTRMGGSIEFLGLDQTPSGRAELADIVKNLRDAVRREPEDFRLDGQRRKRAADFVAGRRTDLTKGLR